MAQTQSANSSAPKSGNSNKTSVIAVGTVIKGDFSTTENLRIDGTIIGDVKCEKRLVIGKKGMINGKIEAAEIAIDGSMIGEAVSKGTITFGSSSKSEGKIIAKLLSVEEGAVFNGDFVITKK
ncbi:MAG: cytoskeletal protein CcmA (bactofilin family) [Maribacter sp.]|jgi:cytoskeletal protein CcmA (bactofilin family)